MPGSPASFSVTFLDDDLANLNRESRLDRGRFRLVVSQKVWEDYQLSSPPDRRQTSENSRQIVGIRVAPVLSTQLANGQSHVRMSAKVATRSLGTAVFAIATRIGGA